MLALFFSEYVCMSDFCMRVCFQMWWFCWFDHHFRGKKWKKKLQRVVYCELQTNKQVYYYNYIFYTDVCIIILDMIVLWAGCQRVYVCMFVVSYVLTITVMSSCTQPTECWLWKTDISVNFNPYEGFYSWIHATFHKAIKYSNTHSFLVSCCFLLAGMETI